MQLPVDPVDAATHLDPYPYYARLVAERPFHFDDALGLWVAGGASVVEDVLASDNCYVRPRDEPVPRALAGSTLGEIFGQLARMTDGPSHASRKAAIEPALAHLDTVMLERATRDEASRLAEALRPQDLPKRVTEFAYRLPVHVVGRLLGIASDELGGVAANVREFVRALAPGSTPEDRELGATAADALIERIERLPPSQDGPGALGLLAAMPAGELRAGNGNRFPVTANAIGLLMQSYEATAGLIGNTLVTLGNHRAEHQSETDRDRLDWAYIEEVLRFDPPVQNTRRFVTEDGVIAGHNVNAGDAILVLLAAANRDPAANWRPHLFDPGRRDAKIYTFGAGSHRCPGSMLATTIALEGVRTLLAAGCTPDTLASGMTYVAAPNVRIPVFHA